MEKLEIATTKSLVVASSVQVLPGRVLLVGVNPQAPGSALRAGCIITANQNYEKEMSWGLNVRII